MPIRENHAANVWLDNNDQVKEFMDAFRESEVSNHFSVTVMPPNRPNDPIAPGILVQLEPHAETRAVDTVLWKILEASFRDGMLARWQAEGRVKMLPRLFAA